MDKQVYGGPFECVAQSFRNGPPVTHFTKGENIVITFNMASYERCAACAAHALGWRAARALLLLLLALALVSLHCLLGRLRSPSCRYSYSLPALKGTGKSIISLPKYLRISYVEKGISTQNEMANHPRPWVLRSKEPNMTRNGSEITTLITKMESLENLVTEGFESKSTESLPLCDEIPPGLGPVRVNKTEVQLDWLETRFPEVHLGRYSPPNCTARHRVAIIVPYRDRQEHLAIFLNHMHPFLMKQQIEYGIFVVEQEGTDPFNRGILLNIGFVESQKLTPGWQCFVFHDVDKLPLDSRNLYSCPRQPRHLSPSIEQNKFRLTYSGNFGGACAMSREQVAAVNGFSNVFWGWGGEDDDMYYRLRKMNYHIARYKTSIARYASLDHETSWVNPWRFDLLSGSDDFQNDGLSNLEYKLVHVVQYHLYTHILAMVDGQ